MNKFFWGISLSSFLLVTIFALSSCKADKLPAVGQVEFCDTIDASYTASVKQILDAKCAIPACHGGPQSPSLSTFADVNARTTRIVARALEQQTMPPANMPQLTNEEIDILNCWKNENFPE